MKGKMPLAVALILTVLLSASIGMVLSVPKNMEEGDPWTWSPGNARFTELQNKDYSWDPIIGDGRWGWIVHGYKMDTFEGNLEVKGMDPDSWYLVTLYSDDPDTGLLLGSVGYYGKETKPNWADIALFQTDSEGNAEIELPYTSPAVDPVYGTLSANQISLPLGTYKDVTVAVKYVGTGSTPDWSLVISGGYGVGETPDARDYNIYEAVPLEFSLSWDGWEITFLYQKDPSTWEIVVGGAWGILAYHSSGSTFEYDFAGFRLLSNTGYSLIYYADPWPGNNPGALIASGSTDGDGLIHLMGSVELNMDLPHSNDANYPTGAKIWLVLSSDYDATNTKMTAWHPAYYLFESELITYDDTDV